MRVRSDEKGARMIKRTKTVLLGLAACLGVCACLSGCVLVERQTEGSVSETVAGEQAFQSDYWYLNRYEAAVGCLKRGELMEAYELFLSISDYRDVSDYLRGFSWRPSVKVFANQEFFSVLKPSMLFVIYILETLMDNR